MNILTINFLTNYNKIYFSGIQNKNNNFSQKNGKKPKELLQINAFSPEAYYKNLNNNNSINFEGRLPPKEDKNFPAELDNAIREGKSINAFCREHNLTPPSFYLRVKKYKVDLNKIKQIQQQIKEQKQKELDEKILENHKNGGNIEEFCKKTGICIRTYILRLRKMGIVVKIENQKNAQKEITEKILKNHQEGGDIKKFCETHNMSIHTYYNHLHKAGIHPQKERQKKQKELHNKILKNYEEGGDIKTFCQTHNIKPCVYYYHLRNKYPMIKKRKFFTPEQSNELNKKILINYQEGGNIPKFCQSEGISISVYYNRLKKLGINIHEKNKTESDDKNND